jgi:hypothetical protein
VKLAQAQALWESGQLAREELPEVAADALVAGLDTPSLRVLAGLTAARMDRAAALADRALQELGHRPMVRLPPAREAALWAEATAAGPVDVLQGVGVLWALSPRTDDAELRAALAGFFEDGQRWQRAIPERPAIERQIVDRARGFLDRWPASV